VDFPWSMWAMMQKLRILETGASVMGAILRSQASQLQLPIPKLQISTPTRAKPKP
jgi:hypothetical protein